MLKLIDFVSLIDAQRIQDIITVLHKLNLRNLTMTNRDWYFIMLENDVKKFKEIVKVDTNASLNSYTIMDIIQNCVIKGNEYAAQEYKMNIAIREINILLSGNQPLETFNALIKDNAMLPPGLMEEAAPLYHFELQLAKQDKRDDLTHEELTAAVEVLQCVAAVNLAIDNDDSDDLYKALTMTDSYFENLDIDYCDEYLVSLKTIRENKTQFLNNLLTHSEIQSVIDEYDKLAKVENNKVDTLQRLNESLMMNDSKETMKILNEPNLDLSRFIKDSSDIYFYSLLLERSKKIKIQDTDDLSYDEVVYAMSSANDLLVQAGKLGLKLTAINLALDKQDAVEIYHYLTNRDLCINNVIRDCKEIYLQRMLEVKRFKISDTESQSGSGWLQCRLADKPISFCYNVKDRCLIFKPCDETIPTITRDSSLLNREELQAIIDMVNTEFRRELLFLSNEDFIINLQSLIRGYLVREKFRARMRYFTVNEMNIIKIQSFWRMYKCRAKYEKLISHYHGNIPKIIQVQSIWRMKVCMKSYRKRQIFYDRNLASIIIIQAAWRGYLIRKNYRALLFEESPSIKTIKRFLYLLENSFNDYQEEIEIQNYKQQICNAIRQNRLLEDQINMMDLKIGLLVRNRITLEELLSHHSDLKNFRSSVTATNGLNDTSNDILLQTSINRTTRQKIESYQHLFYLLQTDPNYLANLVSEMPHMQQTKFVETVIFSLYNYGSSNRDEFLLLKLFKKAVECEINTKLNSQPNEFLSANPYVVKLIVGLCRTAHAQASLKQILQPLIKSVIDDESLHINTNPVEVYKHWVADLEMNSGSPCGLPYEVTLQVALKHAEVRLIIEKSVLQLKQTCQKFIRALLKSPEKLPYSMRYMAKVIKECLHQKFPEHLEKDILKVVGNLIYYRYINSAIVAPDAFDMLERNIANVLPPEKRRNLASIAKLLQFATSNKGFGFESPHLAEVLNPFIRQCHEKFKEYFREVCHVDRPDVYFNMNQYTDVISLTKPVIRMTLKEIRDTHKLLLQYENEIAPDLSDPLHELLKDLGESPPGDYYKDLSNQNTLLWLTLQPKHETQVINTPDFDKGSGDKASNNIRRSSSAEPSKTPEMKPKTNPTTDLTLDTLFIQTKRLVIDMLNCMDLRPESDISSNKTSLEVYLESFVHESEEYEHLSLTQNRHQLDRSLTPALKKLGASTRSKVMELNLSLEEKREQIRINLSKLESAGLVSSSNDYQDMLNAIVTDIRTLKNYRCLRKTEITHLKNILDQLSLKRQFHEDQMDYYEKYCQSCLENLNTKGKLHVRSKSQYALTQGLQNQLNLPSNGTSNDVNSTPRLSSPTIPQKTIKFTASELKKKGVILEIDSLLPSQYKNLQFEITNIQENNSIGEFKVNAKFLGVHLDSVNLSFSDLLQMQYEGKTVMKMFNRALVNINLLVYMINKKFFAK